MLLRMISHWFLRGECQQKKSKEKEREEKKHTHTPRRGKKKKKPLKNRKGKKPKEETVAFYYSEERGEDTAVDLCPFFFLNWGCSGDLSAYFLFVILWGWCWVQADDFEQLLLFFGEELPVWVLAVFFSFLWVLTLVLCCWVFFWSGAMQMTCNLVECWLEFSSVDRMWNTLFLEKTFVWI